MNTQALAEFMYQRWVVFDETKGSFANIVTPIDKVDNILCDVVISYNKHGISYRIETKQIAINDEDTTRPYKIFYSQPIFKLNDNADTDLFKVIFDKWFMDISELKFNKLTSIFGKEAHDTMWNFLKDIPNVSCGEECCVCNEPTKHKTTCNHSVCIPCFIQIKKDDEHKVYCPICRNEEAILP